MSVIPPTAYPHERRSTYPVPIISGADGRALATNVRIATGIRERMVGLIGRRRLGPHEALVIPGAAQVHTFGLRFAIDVAFCDGTGTVLHVVRRMPPRRVSRWVRGVEHTIEMGAGSLASIGRGDLLELKDL